MSRFDDADRAISASFDRELADPIQWRPMRPKEGGDRIVIDPKRSAQPYAPDPARIARPLPGQTDFVGIVTWKTWFIGASDVDQTHRDVLSANDVMIDIDRGKFVDPDGVERLPDTGDIFIVKYEDGSDAVVQQTREPYDDGSRRIVVFCIQPEG